MNPELADVLAKSGEAVKAGPIGLVVILLLCVASYFLFKSMSKQLRKVREHFPSGEYGPSGEHGPSEDEPGAPSSTVDLVKRTQPRL